MSRQGLYDINVERRISELSKDGLSEEIISDIRDFVDECYIKGIGEHRVVKYIVNTRDIYLVRRGSQKCN